VTPERWNLGRRIVAGISVGWVPLVVLTLLLKPHSIGDLLTDYVVNVRMLIAVSTLLAGQVLMDFKIDAIVLLVIALVVAAGPLVLFVPKLGRLRRMGILQYGILGQLHSTGFHKKWVLNRTGHEEEFLSAPEISSLIDYASSYENIEKMQPFLLDRGALVAVLVAVAIPMLPVVLTEIPFVTVLKGLLSAAK
jgi:hypothetical protein